MTLALLPSSLFGQTPFVVGFVTDTEGQPLAGAQVSYPDTLVGGLTDQAGRFRIPLVQGADSLLVELIGYESTMHGVRGHDTIRVELTPRVIQLMGPSPGAPAPAREVPEPTMEALYAAARITDFGLGLFRGVDDNASDENVVFSPLGAALSFALLQEGARGATRSEVLAAFGYDPGEGDRLSDGVADLAPLLVGTDVTFQTGSSLWSQIPQALNADFLDVATTAHGAVAKSIDFDDPSQVAQINQWAAEQTAGRIAYVIDPESPGNTELLLVNAVYFKGLWRFPFDTIRTESAPFQTPPGDSVEVPMMKRLLSVRHHAAEAYAAVRLPYQGERFASYILLPAPGVSLASISDSLTVPWVAAVAEAMRPQRVQLSIPRVLHRNTRDLLGPLRELGVTRVLTEGQADLSGLWEDPELALRWFVDKSSQSTYFRFDEEGTEAAAVTSISVGVTSAPPPPIVFDVNRPYLVLVRDDLTGSVLFVARINDPTKDGS